MDRVSQVRSLANDLADRRSVSLAEQGNDAPPRPHDESTEPSQFVPTASSHMLARQLEQVSAAASLFSLQLDHSQLLEEIARQSVEILRADHCNVYKAVEHGLAVGAQAGSRLVGNNGTSNTVGRSSEYALDPGLGQQAHHPDVDWAARYLHPKLSAARSADGTFRNAICIPLVGTQNRVLGVIEVIGKRNGALFSEADLRTLLCLSRVATTAVDRALLFDRIEHWTRSMETLLSFNATVNQHLEPQEMVRQLVANVTGFLNADGGAAGIVFNVDGTPVAECDSVYFDKQWPRFSAPMASQRRHTWYSFRHGVPVLVNDYATHALADQELAKRFHVKSCICVPIKNANERVLGFFKLHRLAGKAEFTWQDAAFLESLGNTAAVAIENARLVQSLDRKNVK